MLPPFFMAEIMTLNDSKFIHVAVGVIKNTQDEVLIALRPQSAHQGRLWEFSGGKVEQGETVQQALARELKEELAITVQTSQPLIQIKHHYDDLTVLLDVWRVINFSGQPRSCEGQKIQWVKFNELSQYSFPDANKTIITAVQLPSDYAILNGDDVTILLIQLQKLLNQGITLIQARVKGLSEVEVSQFFNQAIPLCQQAGAVLLVNSAVKNARTFNVQGLHLTSYDLLTLTEKPQGYCWVSASCHNRIELERAEKIDLDFVVIAPVLATKTHPDTVPLGWERFKQLAASTYLPVYALGGLSQAEKLKAQYCGAVGIAGISTFL